MAIIKLLFLVLLVSSCLAQPPHHRGCTGDSTVCPSSPPYSTVSITMDEDYRYVKTTGCPPYDNPHWTNPATACTRMQQMYTLPLKPTNATSPIPVGVPQSRYKEILYLKEDPSPIFGAMGVLTSGVMIYGVGSPCGYSSECPDEGAPTKYVDAVESEGHTVDQCGGHAAPTTEYHIHSGIGFNTTSGQQQCKVTVATPGQHSPLLGWMFDGYGIYGPYSQDGKLPNDLDSCGGHMHVINDTLIYHYHMPDNVFPWTIGCFTGCPLKSNNEHEFANLTKYGCN